VKAFPKLSLGVIGMPSYRAYRVDRHHHIVNAEWIEASSDASATAQAEALCEEGAPTIELWQATRLVEEIDCEDD
jgi:hypothetical protein